MNKVIVKTPLKEVLDEIELIKGYLSLSFLLPSQFHQMIEDFYKHEGLKQEDFLNLEKASEFRAYLLDIYEQIAREEGW